MSEIRDLQHLIRANPSLLPAAPADWTSMDIDHRRADGVHMCLACGERAAAAFIADTDAGPRWLDLCMSCSDALRRDALT